MKSIIFSSALLILSATVAVASPASNSAPGKTTEYGKTSFNMELDPTASAKLQQTEAAIQTLYKDGKAALSLRNFVDAEEDFQSALALEHNGPAYLGLAEALAGQGKTAEALQAYYTVLHPGPRESWGGSYIPRAELEYALLLNENGRWPEAVAMYEKALPDVSDHGIAKINAHFDPAVPQPVGLDAAAHIGVGLEDIWASDGVNDANAETAYVEFVKARKLAPDWSAANFYYGYGWQRLDLKSPTRAADAGQAKAALTKAAASSDENIKKAASEALNRMP